MLISRVISIENENVNLDKGARRQPTLCRPAYEHPQALEVIKQNFDESRIYILYIIPILHDSNIWLHTKYHITNRFQSSKTRYGAET
jgi:hypothetical protein